MEFRQLQSFIAAIENENFTRAARTLGITQAAVSKHIAQLEEDLGVRLFERSTRAASPTDSGRCLYDYARQILGLVAEARHKLGNQTPPLTGVLRIAASSVPSEWFLPERLVEFRTRCPQVQVVVDVSDSVEAVEAVLSGAADLGLIGELPHRSGLISTPVADDELVLIGSGNEPPSSKSISLAQLCRQPLIAREAGSASRHCVEQHLADAGIPPAELTIALEMNSNEAIRAAVANGAGFAFQSRRAVKDEIESGRLVAIKLRGVRILRRLYAIATSERSRPPAARPFLDFVQEDAGELRG